MKAPPIDGEFRLAHDRLDRLLSESRTSAIAREQAFGPFVNGGQPRPLVLVGAGRLGRRVGQCLLGLGATIAAYADNDSMRQGTSLHGVQVLSLPEVAELFGADALFVVTIWNGEHQFIKTYEQLTSLGCRDVVSWVPVAWAAGSDLLPQYAAGFPTATLAAKEVILAEFGSWSDARSADAYVNQIAWRLSGDFADLDEPAIDLYFPSDLVRTRPGEVFVDLGAFDGDTVIDFVHRYPDFGVVHAFEPDGENFRALSRTVAGLPIDVLDRIHTYQLATGHQGGWAAFAAGGGASSSMVPAGIGTRRTTRVRVVRLDDVLGTEEVSFVKMDIEGAEEATLLGAADTIRTKRPILAISAYHRQSDVWELPKLIRSLAKDYSLYLRPHRADSFDCVLYAIPNERKV